MFASRCIAVLLGVMLLPRLALGQEATSAGRTELSIGTQASLHSSSRFADEAPRAAITLDAGHYLLDHFRVSVAGALDVLSPDSDEWELFARVSGHARLPILRVFAGLGAGYYASEARGSDWVSNDHGPRVRLDLGARLAIPHPADASVFIEPSLSLSYLLSHSQHGQRNTSYPDWTRSLVATLAIPFSL